MTQRKSEKQLLASMRMRVLHLKMADFLTSDFANRINERMLPFGARVTLQLAWF